MNKAPYMLIDEKRSWHYCTGDNHRVVPGVSHVLHTYCQDTWGLPVFRTENGFGRVSRLLPVWQKSTAGGEVFVRSRRTLLSTKIHPPGYKLSNRSFMYTYIRTIMHVSCGFCQSWSVSSTSTYDTIYQKYIEARNSPSHAIRCL